MRLYFSTDGRGARRSRQVLVRFFAQKVHGFTPGELPDASAFRAEASGRIAGGFALIDIEIGLERVRRTSADVARDKTEALYIRRFRRPLIWKAAPKSTPVDRVYEPGDFGVISSEWQFDAESKGAARFDLLAIPRAVMSPLLAGGRLARPFKLPAASPRSARFSAPPSTRLTRKFRSFPTNSAKACYAT